MNAGRTSGAVMTNNLQLSPVAGRERIVAMDVIRGFALLGILVVNMLFFGYTLPVALHDTTLQYAPMSERVMAWVVGTVFAGKFVSTFSFLFGAGLYLQMTRLDAARSAAAATGARARSTTLLALRRLFILACFGLVHAIVIWYGDILFIYAMVGLLLIPLRFLSTKALAIVAACLLSLSVLCMGGMGLLGGLAPPPSKTETAAELTSRQAILEASADEPRTFDRLVELGNQPTPWSVVEPRWCAFETAVLREGPVGVAMTLRALQWGSVLIVMFFFYGPHMLGMFVLGMAVASVGLLRPSAAALQRRVALVCVPLGLLLSAVLPTMQFTTPHLTTGMLLPGSLANEIGTVLLAIGYISGMAWFSNSIGGPVASFLAAGGRMAFTVYLSMSVLMTGLMYWWGLGHFGEFSRVELFIIAIVTWFALLLLASLWLRVFRMGPLEWVWRAGAYLQLPAMRRTSAPDAGGE